MGRKKGVRVAPRRICRNGLPSMVAWARWIPSGILSAADAIFLIKEAIARGVDSVWGDLLVEDVRRKGNDTKSPE